MHDSTMIKGVLLPKVLAHLNHKKYIMLTWITMVKTSVKSDKRFNVIHKNQVFNCIKWRQSLPETLPTIPASNLSESGSW